MLRCAQHDIFRDLRAFYQLVILSEAKDLIKSTGPFAGVTGENPDGFNCLTSTLHDLDEFAGLGV